MPVGFCAIRRRAKREPASSGRRCRYQMMRSERGVAVRQSSRTTKGLTRSIFSRIASFSVADLAAAKRPRSFLTFSRRARRREISRSRSTRPMTLDCFWLGYPEKNRLRPTGGRSELVSRHQRACRAAGRSIRKEDTLSGPAADVNWPTTGEGCGSQFSAGFAGAGTSESARSTALRGINPIPGHNRSREHSFRDGAPDHSQVGIDCCSARY